MAGYREQHPEERGDGVKIFGRQKRAVRSHSVDLDKLAANLNESIDYFWNTNLPKTDDALSQEMQNLTRRTVLMAAFFVEHGLLKLGSEIMFEGNCYRGEHWRRDPETGKVFKTNERD